MSIRETIIEQIKILANLSREIAAGHLTVTPDGRDYYSMLPEIANTIAKLYSIL